MVESVPEILCPSVIAEGMAKDRGLLVPSVVVTVISRVVSDAFVAIVKVAVAIVVDDTDTFATVIPAPALIVRGEVRRVPVRVTVKLSPGFAIAGEIVARIGVLIDTVYPPTTPSSAEVTSMVYVPAGRVVEILESPPPPSSVLKKRVDPKEDSR